MAWDDRITPLLEAHGESITYYPEAGGSRSITGVVRRDPLQPTPGGGSRSVSPSLRVTVRNSATTGIASTELKLRGDRIGVSERVGGSAVQRPILQLVAHDAGMLEVELA